MPPKWKESWFWCKNWNRPNRAQTTWHEKNGNLNVEIRPLVAIKTLWAESFFWEKKKEQIRDLLTDGRLSRNLVFGLNFDRKKNHLRMQDLFCLFVDRKSSKNNLIVILVRLGQTKTRDGQWTDIFVCSYELHYSFNCLWPGTQVGVNAINSGHGASLKDCLILS